MLCRSTRGARARPARAVVFRPDGHSDFEAIRTKAGGSIAAYVAFDLLALNGKDVRRQPIEDRRAELERIVKGADAILFSEAIAAEGALVFAKACEMGLEGIVSKRVGSIYWSGRCRNWLVLQALDAGGKTARLEPEPPFDEGREAIPRHGGGCSERTELPRQTDQDRDAGRKKNSCGEPTPGLGTAE